MDADRFVRRIGPNNIRVSFRVHYIDRGFERRIMASRNPMGAYLDWFIAKHYGSLKHLAN
jgi:hypothetical protein